MAPRKKYELTDEHRAQLKPWADRWIANALSTKPMDDAEREAAREAVLGLYAAAKLPPPKHVVFVPSPAVLRFAGGFASAIWWQLRGRVGAATDAATDVATSDATIAATDVATRDATRDATRVATDVATSAATSAATDVATIAATSAATSDATSAATYVATRAATYVATSAATSDATRAATRAATYVATRDATRDATRVATDVATSAATRAATDVATIAATSAATSDATSAATYVATSDATSAATSDATRAATYVATSDATSDATRVATDAATRAATRGSGRDWYALDVAGLVRLAGQIGGAHRDLLLACARDGYYRQYQGGNQWSGWVAYLSFFRHVAKLAIDYSAWAHWETLAEVSGPRIMHPDFCMISDRPELLTVDEQSRPHNDTGPFCRWRDGFALYAIHGTRVPQYVVERPETITVADIAAESNAEVRRVQIDRYGRARYLRDAGLELVDQSTDDLGHARKLYRDRGGALMVHVLNSTPDLGGSLREYVIACHPELRPLPDPADHSAQLGEPQALTALNAIASTYGLRGEEYVVEVET